MTCQQHECVYEHRQEENTKTSTTHSTQKTLGENNTDRVPHPLDTATRMYCMLSRSDTERSPDTARTHCCPKVRLLNQPSHRYTSMQFNQRVPTCVAVLSHSTAHPLGCKLAEQPTRVHTARHTLQLQSFAESLSHSRLKGHMIKEHNVVIRHTLTTRPSDAFVDQMKCACGLMLCP